jgi:hypothetical protein
MRLTLRRLCGGISLLTLLVGILSTNIDSLQDHSSRDHATALHSENEAGIPVHHLVRCDAVHKTEPCNVCFFHKVLGNGLIPRENLPAIVYRSVEHTDPGSVAAIHAPFNPDGNRGPPRS